MPVNRPPVWSLDGIEFNGPAQDNVQWIATPDSEPLTAAAPTTEFTPKYQRTGSFWTPGFMERGTSAFTVRAYALDKSMMTLRKASLKALAFLQNTKILYPLVFHSEIGNLVQYVVREGDISITPITGAQHPGIEFELQLAAPDPRRYFETWQTMTVGLPQNSTTGLDFGAPTTLNPNPDFETNTTGWSGTGSATISRQAGGAIGSSWTGRVTSTQASTLSGIVSTAMIPGVVAGTNYRVSAFVKMNGATRRAIIWVDWYTAGSVLISSNGFTSDVLSTTTFDQVTRMADAPATATQAKIRVEQATALALGDFFSVDQIVLQPNTVGLDFDAGPGLDFGPTSGDATISLENTGMAPTAPILTLTGPLTTPVISVSDGSIKYNGTLAAGQTLVINPEDPSALLGGTTSIGYLVNPAQWDAFTVEPGETLVMGLSHSGAPTDTGTLTADFRPAYW